MSISLKRWEETWRLLNPVGRRVYVAVVLLAGEAKAGVAKPQDIADAVGMKKKDVGPILCALVTAGYLRTTEYSAGDRYEPNVIVPTEERQSDLDNYRARDAIENLIDHGILAPEPEVFLRVEFNTKLNRGIAALVAGHVPNRDFDACRDSKITEIDQHMFSVALERVLPRLLQDLDFLQKLRSAVDAEMEEDRFAMAAQEQQAAERTAAIATFSSHADWRAAQRAKEAAAAAEREAKRTQERNALIFACGTRDLA